MTTSTVPKVAPQRISQVDSLMLFRDLILCGAKTQGEVWSKKWADCLYFEDGIPDRVKEKLAELYRVDVDYHIEGDNAVWIA